MDSEQVPYPSCKNCGYVAFTVCEEKEFEVCGPENWFLCAACAEDFKDLQRKKWRWENGNGSDP